MSVETPTPIETQASLLRDRARRLRQTAERWQVELDKAMGDIAGQKANIDKQIAVARLHEAAATLLEQRGGNG